MRIVPRVDVFLTYLLKEVSATSLSSAILFTLQFLEYSYQELQALYFLRFFFFSFLRKL